MSFDQLLFPVVFLPLSVLLFRAVPAKAKKGVLLALSLVFIAWGSLLDLAVIVLSVLFNYLAGLRLDDLRRAADAKRARTSVTISALVNVCLLAFFKYFNFAASTLHIGARLSMAAPVGVSFFTFSALSFLFDVYRGRVKTPGTLADFALYICFFPKLVSGPIIQFRDMRPQFDAPVITRGRTETGMRMFVLGLAKKVLIANTLGLTFNAATADPKGASALTAWLGTLAYTFMLYYDFSGYSDMAEGLSYVFGFRLPRNFKYPYCAESVSDFWRRWHASLGAWFRDYIYIPLGGSRAGDGKTVRNLLIVWALTGVWHGANWTFLVWGLYHGVIIVLEKFVFRGVIDRVPKVLRRAVTFLLAMFGWVFFYAGSIDEAFTHLGRMFAFSHFADETGLYLLGSVWPLLIAAGIGATPLVRAQCLKWAKRGKPWLNVVIIILFAALLALSIAGLVSQTYTSFLYAQF